MPPADMPTWAHEISTTLAATSQYLLSGNSTDLYLVDTDYGRQPRNLNWVLAETLGHRGYRCLIEFDIDRGAWFDGDPEALQPLGEELDRIVPPAACDLGRLGDLIERILNPPWIDDQPPANMALLVHRSDQLVRDPQNLSEDDFVQFRRLDRLARSALPVGELYNPVFWITRDDWDLPPSFGQGSDQVRRMVLGSPDREMQKQAARLLLGPDASQRAIDQFADQTSGMRLTEMVRINSLRMELGLGPEEVVDAARSYRVGVTTNPWQQPQLIESIQHELTGTDPRLPDRVKGQPRAVDKALQILVRSVANLTGAHTSPSATRPRGVLFFAGPTGVGKTELAKAITELIHGASDQKLIRFDMSEFSAEHSADRLIGSPPGYVGHESGGELTNAIRRDPFSVVLFDEIEKADSKVLDKFLQILDDGRLTDSRGDTVFFTEAVIIFTSNLGIYVDESQQGGRSRVRNVERDLPYDEMATKVIAAITQHFTERLERPELLNRIGVDNIVVFDFIRPDVADQILQAMIGRVKDRVNGQSPDRGVHLELTSGVLDDLRRCCLREQDLEMGGRGIGTRLETVLVNPLAQALFPLDLRHPCTVTVEELREKTESSYEVKLSQNPGPFEGQNRV